jgi:acetyltransferase-like isoleucine patch superfamily enzyme
MEITTQEFRELMQKGTYVEAGSEIFEAFHKYSQEALKITSEINSKYNPPEKIRELFSKLTESEIDETFGLFPPFYTDCGKNIKIGKNVFINACCRFQDQGGIEIGDGSLIGHNTTIATLNHDFNPAKRQNLTPSPVKIGKNVWIGSDCTILPGVEIGDGVIIGAGSVVTKSIPANTIAVGNPARVIKEIEVNNV